MKKKLISILGLCSIATQLPAQACTGIKVIANDGSALYSRTFEWAHSPTNPMIKTSPRGTQYSSAIENTICKVWKSKYASIGITSDTTPFINEGVNEKGLVVGMFFFDHYAQYHDFISSEAHNTIDALQLCQYLLSMCENTSQVKDSLKGLRICGTFRKELGREVPVHWRVGDASGKSIIIECVEKKLNVYDDTLGVITNAPPYPYHIINLCNYINISPKPVSSMKMGEIEIYPSGSGSGLLGLPGDFTPVSRFIRAAFFLSFSRTPASAYEAMSLSFTILSNFNIPLSGELPPESAPHIPAATQWTTVIDATNRIIYYRTMYNSAIRRIKLDEIKYDRMKEKYIPLDKTHTESITEVSL